MRLLFGDLMPDLPPVMSGQALVRARNMLPTVGAYAQLPSLETLTGATPLPARPRGSISGIDANGSGYIYAGTEATLQVQGDSGFTDISKSGGYAMAATDRWDFTQFGNLILAVSPGLPMQFHKIGSPDEFADVPAFAPRAQHISAVGNHVIAGNLYDQEQGVLHDAIRWCGINQPLNWPAAGSDAAVSVQADLQPLEGNGGWVQDVVSAAEVGVIFQERQLHRMEYVGGRDIYAIKRLCQGNGMLIPGSAVAFDRMVFYIAEDGFRVFDLMASQTIGKGRVSETFLADLDTAFFDRVETALDSDRTLIWVIYPGVGNVAGRPNRGFVWDYVLDRWSGFELELEGLIESATTTAPSIDSPGIIGDPDDTTDDPAFPDGGIDSAGLSPFDDRASSFGASSIGAFGSTFLAQTFTGVGLDAELETGDLNLSPEGRAFITAVRPLVDGRKVEIAVSGRSLRDDEITFGPFLPMSGDGLVYMRSDARYHRLRVRMPAGWDNAVGLEIHASASGRR